jgi:hypothetical protein
MTRYLISFDSGAMDHIPEEVIGGFGVVDVSSREEALRWAAKLAAACRCSQEVREFLPDPNV